jgi:hypothetical protein
MLLQGQQRSKGEDSVERASLGLGWDSSPHTPTGHCSHDTGSLFSFSFLSAVLMWKSSPTDPHPKLRDNFPC